MEALTNMLESIISADKSKVINTAVRKNHTKITDLNTKGQLQKGLDSAGNIFGRYASGHYAAFKQNLPGREASFGVVDLRLTGAYYKTYFVTANDSDDYFTIDSDPIKDDTNLIEKYGEDIEGLTEESIEKLKVVLLPDVIDGYKRQIGAL